MANYYDVSVLEVNDPNEVGCGSGETKSGNDRICISLTGKRINKDLPKDWDKQGWIALTPAVACELYDLLHSIRHNFLKARGNRAVYICSKDGNEFYSVWFKFYALVLFRATYDSDVKTEAFIDRFYPKKLKHKPRNKQINDVYNWTDEQWKLAYENLE